MNTNQIVISLMAKTIEMCLPWKPLSLYNDHNASILKLKERCRKSAYYTHYKSSVDYICCVFTTGFVYKEYFLFIYDKERLVFKSRSKNDEKSLIKNLFGEAEKIASSSAWIIKFTEQMERLKESLEDAQKASYSYQKISKDPAFRDIITSNQELDKAIDFNSVTGSIPDISTFNSEVKKMDDVIEKLKPIIEMQQKLAEQFKPITRAKSWSPEFGHKKEKIPGGKTIEKGRGRV